VKYHAELAEYFLRQIDPEGNMTLKGAGKCRKCSFSIKFNELFFVYFCIVFFFPLLHDFFPSLLSSDCQAICTQ
jgi:hypothetical protein